jgi:hypothetical protein
LASKRKWIFSELRIVKKKKKKKYSMGNCAFINPRGVKTATLSPEPDIENILTEV